MFAIFEKRNVDLDFFFAGEPVFRRYRRLAKARCVLRLVGRKTSSRKMRDDRVVDIVAPETRVSVRGEDFEHAVVQFENRNVERPAAQVEDRDFRATL